MGQIAEYWDDCTQEYAAPQTAAQRYMAAWDTASTLGYSYLRLSEEGNPGAWQSFIDWLDARNAKSTLRTVTDGNGTFQLLLAKIEAVELEVVRRVR
jgi:hypothetical protein